MFVAECSICEYRSVDTNSIYLGFESKRHANKHGHCVDMFDKNCWYLPVDKVYIGSAKPNEVKK